MFRFQFHMNQDILQDFQQFKGILPEIFEVDSGTYFLMLKHDDNEAHLLEITRIDNEAIGIAIFSNGSEKVAVNILRWFYWIFAQS